MSELQQQVQGLIDGLVESGSENGVQVAVYRRGDLVVDAVAGVADMLGFLRANLDPARTPLASQLERTQRPRLRMARRIEVGLG